MATAFSPNMVRLTHAQDEVPQNVRYWVPDVPADNEAKADSLKPARGG